MSERAMESKHIEVEVGRKASDADDDYEDFPLLDSRQSESDSSQQTSRKKRLNHSIIPRVLAYKEFMGKSVKYTRRMGIEKELLDIANAKDDLRKLALSSTTVRSNLYPQLNPKIKKLH